jgi:hypothetical protein
MRKHVNRRMYRLHPDRPRVRNFLSTGNITQAEALLVMVTVSRELGEQCPRKAETDSVTDLKASGPESCAVAEDRSPHGFLRGSVVIPEGLDLTAPVLDEALMAERREACG